jgi:hypothetical protein
MSSIYATRIMFYNNDYTLHLHLRIFAGVYGASKSIGKAGFSGRGQSNLDIVEVCQL